MFVNADDFRRRAEKLEKLAEQTPNDCLRKSFYSIAANWRALADSATAAPRSLARGPLIDGVPWHYSGMRR
jgi:hypothetical protein